MKNEKNLLVIYLNEFNLNFLKSGAKKYNCKYIKKIFELNISKTLSNDTTQDKDLDPWVQNVSINLGIKSKKHKIFKIGQSINQKQIQIWDILSKRKIECGVWGTMNSKYRKNNNLKFFFPDPWNYNDQPYPNELKNLFYLPSSYAQKYTDFKIRNELNNIFKFFIGCLNYDVIIYFLRNFLSYLKIFFKTGFKNYFLFFLFDVISLKVFQRLLNKNKIKFSIIFLNSLAHFQHNNWDEKENHKKYFFFVNEILKIVYEISKDYNSILIFNGMSQKKIKTEYLIRPKNFYKLFNFLKIKYSKILSNMTNGGFIYFKNKQDKEEGLSILKKSIIANLNIFEVYSFKENKIFFRIQIKSVMDPKLIKGKNLKKALVYEKKYKSYPNSNMQFNLELFLDNMIFIKTTGKHIKHGEIISKNVEIKKKVIYNTGIFSIIKNHFIS